MTGWTQLDAYTKELNGAIETLTNHLRKTGARSEDGVESTPQPLISPEAPVDAHRARQSAMTSIAKLQTLLVQPRDFLQELTKQV